MQIPTLGTIKRPYRHAQRYRQILGILFKYGFGDLVSRLEIDSYVNLGLTKAQKERWTAFEAQTGTERIRRMLEELGPTFIKLGQILSSHRDMLTPSLITELERLQDDVPPFPSEEARKIIEEDLGKPVEEIFESFEAEPFAAASMAQVHHATIEGWQRVVVKIRRPKIDRTVEVDLEIMHHLASLMEKHLDGWKAHSPTRVVEELSEKLKEELNFTHEAAQQEQFAGDLHDEEGAHVPKVHRSHCSHRVLTMEFIDGVKPSNAEKLRAAGVDPVAIAHRGFELLLKQIFVHGFFHADPHPGNIIVRKDSVICYIDFGMMGALSRRERTQFADLVMSISNRDEVGAAEAFTRLTDWEEVPDHEELEKALDGFMDRYFHRSLKDMDIGGLLHELVEIIVSFNMQLPRNLLLVVKALTTVEGVGRDLDPDFDPIKLATPFLTNLKKERLSPSALAKETYRTGTDFTRLIQELPNQLREILRKIRAGQIHLDLDHHGLETLRHTLHTASSRLSLAILIGSIVIGSSIIVLAGVPPRWNEVPIIGILGYVLAAFMGFILIISIWRED